MTDPNHLKIAAGCSVTFDLAKTLWEQFKGPGRQSFPVRIPPVGAGWPEGKTLQISRGPRPAEGVRQWVDRAWEAVEVETCAKCGAVGPTIPVWARENPSLGFADPSTERAQRWCQRCVDEHQASRGKRKQ